MFDPPKEPWEILPAWQSWPKDRWFDVPDRPDLDGFLRQYKFDSRVMSNLRAVLAATDPVSRFDDDEVIETIAWRLATRELVLRQDFRRGSTRDPGGGDNKDQPKPQPAPPAGPSAPAPPAEAPEPNTFGANHDAQAQAGALAGAAKQGAPFCAACEKAKAKPQPRPTPTPKPKKKIIEIHWKDTDGWCSEPVHLAGTTENYSTGEKVPVTVTPIADDAQLAKFDVPIAANQFSREWNILNVLPIKLGTGAHYENVMDVDAHAEDKTTPTHLHIHFIPTVPKTHYDKDYAQGHARFDLTATDYVITIGSDISYVQGWGGEVVLLGPAVPAGTGGLLDGQLSFAGYRWMKTVAGTRKFWDGTAWQNLPAGFALIDANNFAVGFYKADPWGSTYTCQYGGTWPEEFAPWNIDDAANQAKIQKWQDIIHSVWTGKFDIKRHECSSTVTPCCRYSTVASATLTRQDTFAAGMLVVANGDIRSNDSLWFLGDADIKMAAHEFGHHLGNPDEYAGANLDTSMNGDGAANGIDTDSIMGQNMTKVKKRHYGTVCRHFAAMVQTLTGKVYTYEAVAKARG
jgi:hypothetical protein